ncbi:unnamed protein product [Rhizoctonia solani]|uniref:Uncharacterized protein n=1 Tax=Rhizoctonia solani TaxID=456999 RepID=A0A8H3E430_9AGAM|nr:unnamed protein product [Rhizoctonia solani]
MSFPTRAELEGMKRAVLQAKCKELAIKANSKSEVLIDSILGHYQSTAGPSRPTTSNKRKAQDEGNSRRVKAKAEPEDAASVHTVSKRSGVEVVIRSPPKPRRRQAKAKAVTPVADEIVAVKEVTPVAAVVVPQAGPALAVPQPLSAHPTSATIIDTTAQTSMPTDSRIADLELQIRNARKAGDESARDVLALKAFRNAIQQAFGDVSPSDTLDTMTQLAKLRDLTPTLLTFAHLDPEGIESRVEAIERQASEFETVHQQNQTDISDLQERINKLEAELPAATELEVMVRQLQSKFNRIPDSVFNNNRPEDSAEDNRYTIIRPASTAPVAGPSNYQQSSSQPSLPQEGLFPSQNQDQNSGRSTLVVRSSRSSRQPLAEKEKAPEAETDTRRSTPPRQSSHSSRGRSAGPYSRGRSSEPPTPSRGKGKGRLIKTSLDTVNEDDVPPSPVADPFTPTNELSRSPPAATRKSRSPSVPASKTTPPTSFFPPLPTFGASGPVADLPYKLTASSKPPSETSAKSAPIAELPFKLVASTSKPASEPTARPSAPSGRVARTATKRVHAPSVRLPTGPVAQPTFNFALPGAATSATNGTTSTSASTNGHGFITPERLGANFNLFPSSRIDLGRTPGGLAFKTTGRAPPGTPAVTNTLFGTEVARDTRFADLPYDPDASRGSNSWEESLQPVWPVPRNAANP